MFRPNLHFQILPLSYQRSFPETPRPSLLTRRVILQYLNLTCLNHSQRHGSLNCHLLPNSYTFPSLSISCPTFVRPPWHHPLSCAVMNTYLILAISTEDSLPDSSLLVPLFGVVCPPGPDPQSCFAQASAKVVYETLSSVSI